MNALALAELEELYAEMEQLEYDKSITDVEDTEQALKERFKIRDLGGANWAFRKIKALKQVVDDNKALVAEEKARLDNWLATKNNESENSIAFFEGLIIEYFVFERSNNSSFKLSTPHGHVSTRTGDKWKYNEAELVKSLKEAGLTEYIKVTEAPKKDAIKKAKTIFQVTKTGALATSDGEIIKGVTVLKTENVTVKV